MCDGGRGELRTTHQVQLLARNQAQIESARVRRVVRVRFDGIVGVENVGLIHATRQYPLHCVAGEQQCLAGSGAACVPAAALAQSAQEVAMGWRYVALTVVALLLTASCKKGVGQPCTEGRECDEGLACVGDTKRTCKRCEETENCRLTGRCIAEKGVCVPGGEYDPQKEGCPCGCDHSEEMTAELAARGGDEARSAIGAALHTIAEREDAGYITEAMVQHRLRLMRLASDIDGTSSMKPSRRYLPPRTSDARARRGELPVAESDSVRVQSELIVHGETTEFIGERPKLLRACFRLWLHVENLSDEARTVKQPTLAGKVSLPVSRWYIEDSPGDPWDGSLAPGERQSVLAIGYLGTPVKPAAKLDVSVVFESLQIQATAIARGRWNQEN